MPHRALHRQPLFDKWEPFFTEDAMRTFLFGGTLTAKGIVEPYLLPCRCGAGKRPRLEDPNRGRGRATVEALMERSAPYGTGFETKSGHVRIFADAS